MTRTQAVLLVIAACAVVAAGAFAAGGAARPSAAAADPPPAARVDGDRGRVLRPVAQEPLVVVAGNVPGTTLGLLSLRRAGPDVLVATFRVGAAQEAKAADLSELDFDGAVWWSTSGAELRDEATGRATKPEVTNGRCDCSDFHGLRPGESADLGATFKLDAPEGPFVLRLPGFPEIAGIEPAGEAPAR